MQYMFVEKERKRSMVRGLVINCSTCNAASTTRGHIRAVNKCPVLSIRRSRKVSLPFTPVSALIVAPVFPVVLKDRQLAAPERLQLGSLAEDGLSYKEKFIIRSSEVGNNKTATIETIAKLLQEVSCNQIQSLGFTTDGFGTTLTMRKLHLIWVISRMHIEINKYPAWSDVVEIEIWCQGEGKIGIRRDWILKDHATGEVIGRATSKWVMMNQDTRRIQKLSGDVRDEYLLFCPKTPRLAFPEENNKSMLNIPKLYDPAPFSKLGLVTRRGDFDMNKHINNVTYMGWLLESMPQEVIDTHELQSITLDYRYECQHDDVVDSLASLEDNNIVSNVKGGCNGSSSTYLCKFLHSVRLSHDGLEMNRGRTVWRRKQLH